MTKEPESKIYEFEEFRLDAAHLMLYRNGREIFLPPKAIETLLALVAGGGRVLSKEELMEIIWADSIVEESNLSQYLHLVRKTLGDRSDGKPFIETLRRRGYRFIADVSLVEPEIDRGPRADMRRDSASVLPPDLLESAVIGREKEIEDIVRLLRVPDVRLMTITGVGGVGKTTLAHSVAVRLQNDFADGVFFVELAAVTDPEFANSTVASLLGVKEAGGKSAFDALKDHLRRREMLLIVDNFEQVVSAAPYIADLLAAAKNLKIVVTSRVLLHLSAEREFVVPPLSMPPEKLIGGHRESDPNDLSGQLQELSAYEAVRLFVVRAQKAKPTFSLTNENADSVAEICLRLEGLPLAIELAAARVKLLSPDAILARLQSQLRLLTGGERDLPARQQTMRGTVAWSYDLLNEGEKELFRRLSVFAGGFTLEAVEAVSKDRVSSAADDSESLSRQIEVLDILTSLIDKSLVLSRETASGETRFRMLEVVREFAGEALQASGEKDRIDRRHAEYFLALGEEAEPFLQAAQSVKWLSRLEDDHDNIRAALRWALQQDAKLGQQLAGAIWRFWWLHGHIRESCDWLDSFLSRAETTDEKARTKVLLGAAFLNRLRGNFDLTRKYADEGRALAMKTADKKSAAFATYLLALLAMDDKHFDVAEPLFQEGLVLARESGDLYVLALLLNGLGELSRSRFDYDQAGEFYRQALTINQEIGDVIRQVTNLINLGATAISQNNIEAAGEFYREGLEISSKAADMNGSLYCLEGVAGAYWATRDAERAAVLFGAADAVRTMKNLLIEPADRMPYEQSVNLVRSLLTERVFAECFADGGKLELDECIALALSETTISEIIGATQVPAMSPT